jgi:hypothetical protein
MTFWMEILAVLKNLLKNPQIYEVMPIELFVDIKNLHKLVKISHKIMPENFIFLNIYL